jgi:hypothetical protein
VGDKAGRPAAPDCGETGPEAASVPLIPLSVDTLKLEGVATKFPVPGAAAGSLEGGGAGVGGGAAAGTGFGAPVL